MALRREKKGKWFGCKIEKDRTFTGWVKIQ